MVRSRESAVKVALSEHTNDPGMCQMVTREWFDAPSVGDFDNDGSADAEDGWKHEPASTRHPLDRRPPRGTPVSWGGGSSDSGHRAISLGEIDGVFMIRSTDAAGRGRIGTVPLSWVEKQWGLPYLGWSETISGLRIPIPVPSPPPPPTSHKANQVSKARALLMQAHQNALDKGNSTRASLIKKMLDVGPKR